MVESSSHSANVVLKIHHLGMDTSQVWGPSPELRHYRETLGSNANGDMGLHLWLDAFEKYPAAPFSGCLQ
ncbi:hypothetical protein ILYODFUR_033023 [Ilyodon furcidens]|uniref:Uncharacterized protein n=1 Tax=Ilyodon furcidens TaxID=33524 RepID=A0ABV0U2J3_9TELE